MGRQEYADDTGLYTSCTPTKKESRHEMIQRVHRCIKAVRKFLLDNKSKVNDDKTVLMLIGTPYWLSYLDFDSIQVGEATIKAVDSTINLGIKFDKEMDFEDHIKSVCRKGYFHIKNLFYLGRFLDESHRNTVAHCFVTSLLDYGNSLFMGLPNKLIKKLQMLQNAAVRTVVKKRKFDHISEDRVKKLHWLPVEARIKFKIALLTWKCLNQGQPEYLKDLLTARTNTRQIYHNTLYVPLTKRATWGDRAFQKAAPELWNSLPDAVRNQENIESFKKRLKTHFLALYGKKTHLTDDDLMLINSCHDHADQVMEVLIYMSVKKVQLTI